MNRLNSEIKYLKGVGEFKAKLLAKLDIYTMTDLLDFFPRTYINRKVNIPISHFNQGDNVSFIGKILSVNHNSSYSGKKQLIVRVGDQSGNIYCKWFRFGKWLIDELRIGEEIWIGGTINEFAGKLEIIHPQIELLGKEIQDKFWENRSILPVYNLTASLTMQVMRKLILNLFRDYHQDIEETLPDYILKRKGFEPRYIALQRIHFPTNLEKIAKAKKRFVFEELFYQQLMLARVYYSNKIIENGYSFRLYKTLTTQLKKELPFEMTNAQKKVLKEIVKDMTSKKQMRRLIQGDVGSGKTIVVLFAMLIALENGFQAAIVAPTELLAEQHLKSISNFLKNQSLIKIELLKGGNYKGKKKIKENIANGEVNIIIGTHALFQKDISFKKLGLVVIDEQHRFGVKQRSVLSQKNNSPDLLYLSATPIPRSLSLTVFGDLDISRINELPPTRKPVKTIWKGSSKKKAVYKEIEKELIKGRQAYVVCPLVEESEKLDLLDATTIYSQLQNDIFKNFRCALLHGRMKTSEKDEIMRDFKNHKYDILVSTTVIEVGIDVANATIMMIEHAERFGLSQLHQLRGRVGRGSEASFCYLISYPPISKEGRERLSMMSKTNDGFLIAEKDLELRGPGEFFGTVQSGMPSYRHANILRDQEVLKEAREMAIQIIKSDYELKSENHKRLHNNYFSRYYNREKLFKF
jgi:ATP-dependent DNA helicase RecG